MRQKKLHPSLAWRQVIKESKKQFCKARDAKGREAVPEPQICRHSVQEVLREERFRASLVNRNGDGCQVGSITPLAPTPRRPRRGIPSPARSPQRHCPRLPVPTEEPPAWEHGSTAPAQSPERGDKHPAAGRAERRLRGPRVGHGQFSRLIPYRNLHHLSHSHVPSLPPFSSTPCLYKKDERGRMLLPCAFPPARRRCPSPRPAPTSLMGNHTGGGGMEPARACSSSSPPQHSTSHGPPSKLLEEQTKEKQNHKHMAGAQHLS